MKGKKSILKHHLGKIDILEEFLKNSNFTKIDNSIITVIQQYLSELFTRGLAKFIFADETVYFDGEKATSAAGTLAGSTKLLPDIIQILGKKRMFRSQFIDNPYNYHNIEVKGSIEWDENFNIVKVD